MATMLKTINGYNQTGEARRVEAAIAQRHAGAALFAPAQRPLQPQVPKL